MTTAEPWWARVQQPHVHVARRTNRANTVRQLRTIVLPSYQTWCTARRAAQRFGAPLASPIARNPPPTPSPPKVVCVTHVCRDNCALTSAVLAVALYYNFPTFDSESRTRLKRETRDRAAAACLERVYTRDNARGHRLTTRGRGRVRVPVQKARAGGRALIQLSLIHISEPTRPY